MLAHLIMALAILALPLTAQAWNSRGHMVIAALAWHELPEPSQEQYAKLLEHHPDFPKWKAAHAKDSQTLPLALYAFMKASTWPDTIRRSGSPHDQPTWHYLNLPLTPPDFPHGQSIGGEILGAIELNRDMLGDEDANKSDRAIALSWLLHLIADLHQPLHAVALVNDQFPTGDRGGNLFWVRPNSAPVKLHSFWDGLLGSSPYVRTANNQALLIRRDSPKVIQTALLIKANTPREWAQESRWAALDHVYLGGKLDGAVIPTAAPGLPQGYAQRAKAVAQHRAALAAYRVVEVIGPEGD